MCVCFSEEEPSIPLKKQVPDPELIRAVYGDTFDITQTKTCNLCRSEFQTTKDANVCDTCHNVQASVPIQIRKPVPSSPQVQIQTSVPIQIKGVSPQKQFHSKFPMPNFLLEEINNPALITMPESTQKQMDGLKLIQTQIREPAPSTSQAQNQASEPILNQEMEFVMKVDNIDVFLNFMKEYSAKSKK
jgi:hypothetical protein